MIDSLLKGIFKGVNKVVEMTKGYLHSCSVFL